MLVTRIRELGLKRPPWFDFLSLDEIRGVYNGYGPDSWPKALRAVMTWIYRNFRELAVIHDLQFDRSLGTEAGWRETQDFWRHNCSLLLSDVYPMRRVWAWPARSVAWTKLQLSCVMLERYGYAAYVAAANRRGGG